MLLAERLRGKHSQDSNTAWQTVLSSLPETSVIAGHCCELHCVSLCLCSLFHQLASVTFTSQYSLLYFIILILYLIHLLSLLFTLYGQLQFLIS